MAGLDHPSRLSARGTPMRRMSPAINFTHVRQGNVWIWPWFWSCPFSHPIALNGTIATVRLSFQSIQVSKCFKYLHILTPAEKNVLSLENAELSLKSFKMYVFYRSHKSLWYASDLITRGLVQFFPEVQTWSDAATLHHWWWLCNEETIWCSAELTPCPLMEALTSLK